MVTRGRGGASDVCAIEEAGRACRCSEDKSTQTSQLRVMSKNFPASGSRQSTSIQTDLRVVYRMENDVGRPGDDRRSNADESCHDRQADVGAQEKRTDGLQTPPSPTHRQGASTPRSQTSDPLYGKNTRRRRWGVAITHLSAGQATKEDRTSGPSPSSGLSDSNTGRSTDWLPT